MSSSHSAMLEMEYWRQLARLQRLLVHDIGNLQVGYQYAQQKVAELDGKMLAIGAHLLTGVSGSVQPPSMADIAAVMHELQSKYNEPVAEILQENSPRLGMLLAVQGLFALYDEPLSNESFSLAEILTPLQSYFLAQCTKQRMQMVPPEVVEGVVETSPAALALVAVAMLNTAIYRARSQDVDKSTKPSIKFGHALVAQEGRVEDWLLLEAVSINGVAAQDASPMMQKQVWQPKFEILAELGVDASGDLKWALLWLESVGGGAKLVDFDGGHGLVCGLPVKRLS